MYPNVISIDLGVKRYRILNSIKKNQVQNLKKKKTCSRSRNVLTYRPIQWYHSLACLICRSVPLMFLSSKIRHFPYAIDCIIFFFFFLRKLQFGFLGGRGQGGEGEGERQVGDLYLISNRELQTWDREMGTVPI